MGTLYQLLLLINSEGNHNTDITIVFTSNVVIRIPDHQIQGKSDV